MLETPSLLTNDARQVLFGSLLGDGHLSINRRRGINALYSEIHSLKHASYLLWKKPFFEEISPLKITTASYFDKRTNKTYYHMRLRTHVHPYLTELHNLVYIRNRKTVHPPILNQIDPLGLAVWYMDDGSYCYKSRWSKIATCDFSLEENRLIKNYLESRFNLKVTIYFHKWCLLYLNVQSTRTLFSIIEPYVPECMSYKLGKDEKKEEEARRTAKLWEIKNRKKRKEQRKNWYIRNRERYLETKQRYYFHHKEVQA